MLLGIFSRHRKSSSPQISNRSPVSICFLVAEKHCHKWEKKGREKRKKKGEKRRKMRQMGANISHEQNSTRHTTKLSKCNHIL